MVVAVVLVAGGCSVDVAVEVTDELGNPTIVPVNAGSVSLADDAATTPITVAGSRDDAAGDDAAGDGAAADEALAAATPTVGGLTPESATAATPTPDDPGPTTEPTAVDDGNEPPTADDTSDDTEDDAATVSEEESTATPLPSGPPPDEDATPTPTPTPTPTVTSTPTAATPAATPTPAPIEFLVGPEAPLLGVALGTDATIAIDSLEATIGEPDYDSGWYVGCPLDGDEDDERLLQWGDLNVYFDRSDGTEVLRAWGYDLRIVDGGFPGIDLIELPGGATMGDPVNEVAAAAGLEVRYDDLFDVNRVGEEGYEILSDAPPGAPVWGVFVPGIPTCE